MKWLSVQICSFCWFQMAPDRTPVRVRQADRECCYECGEWTKGGIYVRRPERTGEEFE